LNITTNVSESQTKPKFTLPVMNIVVGGLVLLNLVGVLSLFCRLKNVCAGLIRVIKTVCFYIKLVAMFSLLPVFYFDFFDLGEKVGIISMWVGSSCWAM